MGQNTIAGGETAGTGGSLQPSPSGATQGGVGMSGADISPLPGLWIVFGILVRGLAPPATVSRAVGSDGNDATISRFRRLYLQML